MNDTHATLAWMDAICENVLAEARQGNTIPANQLGSHPALGHYFNNVHCLRAIRAEAWAREFPALLADADRLRQEDDAARRTTVRLTALEGKLARLADQIAALVGK
jgi:hypothetical protein